MKVAQQPLARCVSRLPRIRGSPRSMRGKCHPRLAIHPSIGPPQCLMFSSSHLKSPRAPCFEIFQSRAKIQIHRFPSLTSRHSAARLLHWSCPCNFTSFLHILCPLLNLPIQNFQLLQSRKTSTGFRCEARGATASGSHTRISHGGKSHAGPQRS